MHCTMWAVPGDCPSQKATSRSPAWAIWWLRRMPRTSAKARPGRCEAARAHVMLQRPAKAELIRTACPAVKHLGDAMLVRRQDLAEPRIVGECARTGYDELHGAASLWCWGFENKKSMPVPRTVSEGCVLQRTRRGGWASHGLRRGGGIKDALRSPGREAAGRCSLCSSSLRCVAQSEEAGVKAGTHCWQWGGRLRPGLDARATGDYLAWPFKEEEQQRSDAARGAGTEKIFLPLQGFLGHGKPTTGVPQHTARPVKDHSYNHGA